MTRHGTPNRTSKNEICKRSREATAVAIAKEQPDELMTEQLDKVAGGSATNTLHR